MGKWGGGLATAQGFDYSAAIWACWLTAALASAVKALSVCSLPPASRRELGSVGIPSISAQRFRVP